jgi:hypothetical protein
MSDLSSLIISILPYAIGAAISPLILATLIETISSIRSPRLSSFAYLFGSIIFFLILVFSGLYIGSGLSIVGLKLIGIGGIIEVALGGILVIIALKTLFVREEPREGGLLGFVNTLRENNNFSIFIKFFYFGFITFLASFATSILILIAGTIIGLSNPGFTLSAITIIILGLITLILIEIPFIIYLISPQRAGDILTPARNWITQYGDYLTTIAYLFLGFFFLIRGFLAI